MVVPAPEPLLTGAGCRSCNRRRSQFSLRNDRSGPNGCFVQLIQDTGVPAIAPLITFQAGNFIAVFRQAGSLLAGVTLNFCISVDGIKAQTKAPAVVQTISTAQVQVQRRKIGFTAVFTCRIVVIEFSCKAVVGRDGRPQPNCSLIGATKCRLGTHAVGAILSAFRLAPV